jgi:hypothetical protein
MLQHSKRKWWLQEIVKRLVMKVRTGYMWLVIGYRSEFCVHGKDASYSATRRQPHLDISE